MRKKTKIIAALVILILVLAAWWVVRQFSVQKNGPVAEQGVALAKKYCASCHLYPDRWHDYFVDFHTHAIREENMGWIRDKKPMRL